MVKKMPPIFCAFIFFFFRGLMQLFLASNGKSLNYMFLELIATGFLMNLKTLFHAIGEIKIHGWRNSR